MNFPTQTPRPEESPAPSPAASEGPEQGRPGEKGPGPAGIPEGPEGTYPITAPATPWRDLK